MAYPLDFLRLWYGLPTVPSPSASAPSGGFSQAFPPFVPPPEPPFPSEPSLLPSLLGPISPGPGVQPTGVVPPPPPLAPPRSPPSVNGEAGTGWAIGPGH